MTEDKKEPQALSEIKSLRGEKRKVYRAGDRCFKAVYSPDTIHYYDEETKEYHTPDNSLFRDDEGKYYVNGRGNFKARFSRREEDEELFILEKGMYKVTVSANRNAKRRGCGLGHRLHSKKEKSADKTLQDTVVYTDAYDEADLTYSVENTGIKENIIINEKKNVYRYSFVLNCENLICTQGEDGIIRFLSCESSEEIFYIPVSFMYDAGGVTSYAVTQELRTHGNDTILTVSCDSSWINADERVFPVTVDPQISIKTDSKIKTYSCDNGVIKYDANIHSIGGKSVNETSEQYIENFMYIRFHLYDYLPLMRIKKAELKITQKESFLNGGKTPRIGLYKAQWDVNEGSSQPSLDKNLTDYAIMKSEKNAEYIFDITALADYAFRSAHDVNLALKLVDAEDVKYGYIDLYGDAHMNKPELIITYEPGYVTSESYRCHTHDIGKFGTGMVDLSKGCLTLESTDFAWEGNRMPVTIKHIYNNMLGDRRYTEDEYIQLHVADFFDVNVGYGYRLNIMQSMVRANFMYDGVGYDGYIFTDEEGNEMYFKASDECLINSNNESYMLYEYIGDGETLYDPELRTFTYAKKKYDFDDKGRLIKITDSYGNTNEINYTSGMITSVTDGAGRSFDFSYTGDGYLASITAPDDTSICYSYTDGYLTGITYPDGSKAEIDSGISGPHSITLKSSDDKNLYRVSYTYGTGGVYSVTEYGVQDGEFVKGASSEYSYNIAAKRTVVRTTQVKDECEGETQDTYFKTVYTFDDDGNITGEYAYTEDTGNVQVSGEAGINPYMGDGGMGYIKGSDNRLINHNFTSLKAWDEEKDSCGDATVLLNEGGSLYGNNCVRISSDNVCTCGGGINQMTYFDPDGDTYTFSAYINVIKEFTGPNSPGAFIRVTDMAGNVLSESEHIKRKTDGYVRLATTFSGHKGYVKVHILVCGKGMVYADGAQLEKGEYAGEYNYIENGSFNKSADGWSIIGTKPNMAPEGFDSGAALMLESDFRFIQYAYQVVPVKTYRDNRETFTLSGWAKAPSIPVKDRGEERQTTFRLRAVIHYYDKKEGSNTEEFYADFSPCTDEWQYVSLRFAKSKYRSVGYIRVYCEYEMNNGEAYFDGISLVRNSLETGLSQEDFTATDSSIEENVPENVQEEASLGKHEQDDTDSEEAHDEYGNVLTETTYKNGIYGTIYRSFGYNNCCCGLPNSGNDRIRETDARGNDTLYTVDADTSRVTSVTDRCGAKTVYEYDSEGRTTKTSAYDRAGSRLSHISYKYDTFDNITEIARGDGMKYELSYNEFHKLSSIGIRGKTNRLINYAYKEGNGRLKEVSYANGDTMKIAYNRMGQVVSEKWHNKNGTLTAHYRYVYDGSGNIVKSVDVISKKEYNYMYENGCITRASENNIVINSEGIITKRTLTGSIIYSYDKDGNLIKKVISSQDKAKPDCTISYEYYGDSGIVSHTVCGGTAFTSRDGTDDFGRKNFDEVQTGIGFITRQFTYHDGKVTDEHKNNEKIVSGPVTNLVKRIVMSDGRILSYEYDREERIRKVAESDKSAPDTVVRETVYTYDSLGQLIKETRDGVTVNEMTYDKYGNIKTRNGIAYTYGNSIWKDQLTGYGDKSISYDSQGNPVSYLGHTLTWEKGRQLKKFDSNTYTYNAGGIRTGKTVSGVKHSYRLDGTKILSEKWGSNTLTPLYDNKDEVCGIVFNGASYYFLKNLQGDVISILDSGRNRVAEYLYDAWGVCTVVSDETEERIAEVNPFRYRSYYYDSETGMYYLQSRYYDPVVGRFLCIDEFRFLNIGNNIQRYNLFVVCDNDTVNYIDNTGNKKKKATRSVTAVRSNHWLIDLCNKLIPNFYTESIDKTLFDKKFLGVRLTIKVGYALNSNSSGVFGMLISNHASEITLSASINQRESFFIGGGIDWRKIYMQCGLAVTSKNPIITYALTIQLSVSHLTSAAIIACCVAAPYLSTFLATVVTAVESTASAAASMLVPMIPKFVELVV